MEARRWLEGVEFTPDRPLINVSQAAPVDPPPPALRQAMADAALTKDDAHLYGPVLGMPALRTALSAQINTHYGADTRAENICITSGCNQAFAAALSTLCAEGDEVILPTPVSIQDIATVNVLNRTDCCEARAENITIKLVNMIGAYTFAL